MGRRLLYLIIVVILVVGAYFGYQNYSQRKQLADGDVQCVGCMSAEEEAQFRKQSASENADNQPERKTSTVPIQPFIQPTTEAKFPDGPPSVTQAQPVAVPAPATAKVAPTTAATQTNQTGTEFYSPPVKTGMPAGDTLPPNSPNGVAFSGKGPYQWYRQGNLTWRLNTETGASCVAYATMEEWSKPIVLRHGCGNSL